MESSSRNKWQIRLAALVIFILGFIAGGLTLNIYHARQGASSYGDRRGGFDRMIERLNLTPEQKAQVKSIFDDAREQLDDVRKESGPKFREVRERADARMREVLTPEQWEQFQQIMREHREKRGRSRDGRDGRSKRDD